MSPHLNAKKGESLWLNVMYLNKARRLMHLNCASLSVHGQSISTMSTEMADLVEKDDITLKADGAKQKHCVPFPAFRAQT